LRDLEIVFTFLGFCLNHSYHDLAFQNDAISLDNPPDRACVYCAARSPKKAERQQARLAAILPLFCRYFAAQLAGA
jgi:hypothetical protein